MLIFCWPFTFLLQDKDLRISYKVNKQLIMQTQNLQKCRFMDTFSQKKTNKQKKTFICTFQFEFSFISQG